MKYFHSIGLAGIIAFVAGCGGGGGSGKPVELAPQSAHIRRLQHQLIEQHGLGSESRGEVPWRRVIVLPTRG